MMAIHGSIPITFNQISKSFFPIAHIHQQLIVDMHYDGYTGLIKTNYNIVNLPMS